jgi:hypothetical protein
MHVKTLCNNRSSVNPSGGMASETTSIPDPQTAWVRSTMNEAKIQALVDHGLLRPKGGGVEGRGWGVVPERRC